MEKSHERVLRMMQCQLNEANVMCRVHTMLTGRLDWIGLGWIGLID